MMAAAPRVMASGAGNQGERMKSRIVLALVAGWMALVAVPSQAQSHAMAPAVSAQARAAVADAGRARVVVSLRPRTGSAQAGPSPGRALRMAQIETTVDSVLAALPSGRQALRRRFALVPAVVVDVGARDLEVLQRHPAVIAVDIDVGGSAGAAIAPDTASRLNQLAGLDALGLGGKGRKVAVIDSGVDGDHADLAARLIDEACFCTVQGSSGCCPDHSATQFGSGSAADDNGHGTNVTGIIVGEGVIAPRGAVPDAQLVAVKVIDADGRYCCASDVVAAMDWLATRHPDVVAVNLSLGSDETFPGDCDASTAWTQALAAGVDALVANGAVVTVSTGNQGNTQQAQAPACIRKALSVAATWDSDMGVVDFLGCSEATATRQPACFANRSPTTDLFAAGAFVTSTGYTGGTSIYGGTSQAAPMAAACAVALSQAAPAATVAQRVDAMVLSTTRIDDPASGRVYPFLDCRDAVALLNPAAIRALPANGARPLLPPSRDPAAASLPALPAVARRSPAAGAHADHDAAEQGAAEGRAPHAQRKPAARQR
jgi:subtilisin family serine protease